MNGLIFETEKFFKKHGTTILSIFGSVGVVATAVLTSKATIKAIDILDTDRDKLTKKEKIARTWTCFVPATLTGVASIGCIVSSTIINKRIQSGLMNAYLLLDSSYDLYKSKLKELYGEEAHNNIMDSIVKSKVKDTYIYTTGLIGGSTLEFDSKDPDVTRTFYDAYSKRYFDAKISKVLEAEYHLNRNHILGGVTRLNDFYEFLGLAPIEGGDDVGWESYYTEIYWIDFSHSITTLDDGMEICVIDFEWYPQPFAYEE